MTELIVAPILFILLTFLTLRLRWIVQKQPWIRQCIKYEGKGCDGFNTMLLKFWVWDINKFIR